MCKNYQILITGVFLCLLLHATLLPSNAQQKKIKKVQAFYDSSAIPEIFQQVPVGFRFTFNNGSTAATRGFLNGKIRWKDIKVRSAQGTINDGQLGFDPEKVWNNNHRVTFEVTYKGENHTCTLLFPYLKEIHFNFYTDSIKRGAPFYLNTEGLFSSGKIYPLDTGKLRFYVSGGELTANILHLPEKDSTIKKICIRSVFKWDPTITDSAVVPVKIHIKEVHLPTEKELLQQWKKQRKQN